MEEELIADCEWKDAEERGEMAKMLLMNIGFTNVMVYKNLPKEEIDELLLGLKHKALNFEETKKHNEG